MSRRNRRKKIARRAKHMENKYGNWIIENGERIWRPIKKFIPPIIGFGKKHGKHDETPYQHVPGWWGKDVKLEITQEAYNKMVYYCKAVSTEISGFGKIETTEEDGVIKKITIVDVILLEQTCTHGGTTLTEDDLHTFLYNMMRKKQKIEEWKVWWHTHNNFGVFWSGIDEANIERMTQLFGQYLVSTCINKDCHLIARIDQVVDGIAQTEQVKIGILPKEVKCIKKECEREAQAMVKEYHYTADKVSDEFDPETGVPLYSKRFYQPKVYQQPYYGNHQPVVARTEYHGRYAVSNIMNNAERRKQGLPQDPDLADYRPEFNNFVPDHGFHGHQDYDG